MRAFVVDSTTISNLVIPRSRKAGGKTYWVALSWSDLDISSHMAARARRQRTEFEELYDPRELYRDEWDRLQRIAQETWLSMETWDITGTNGLISSWIALIECMRRAELPPELPMDLGQKVFYKPRL